MAFYPVYKKITCKRVGLFSDTEMTWKEFENEIAFVLDEDLEKYKNMRFGIVNDFTPSTKYVEIELGEKIQKFLFMKALGKITG